MIRKPSHGVVDRTTSKHVHYYRISKTTKEGKNTGVVLFLIQFNLICFKNKNTRVEEENRLQLKNTTRYLPLFSDTEVNNCFSIYQTSG